MNNKNDSKSNNNIRIEQLTPQQTLKKKEKKELLNYAKQDTEELSKTMQFKILNAKNKEDNNPTDIKTSQTNEEKLSNTSMFRLLNSKKNNQELELPKKAPSLSETIRLKISDLRAKIDEESDLPSLKKKKSLYDTVIIKLDDLINNRKALKNYSSQKVTNIEQTNIKKRFHFFKPRDITKMKNIKLNVESDEFGRQLYNLNKIALINLSNVKNTKVRKSLSNQRIGKIEKIHISKTNYLQYQSKLNTFAINKLYYKFAPKETKKYKIYKYSVIASSFVFALTSIAIINWFIQGINISNLSNGIKEETPIEYIPNEGEIYNLQPEDNPNIESNTTNNQNSSDKFALYWKYVNTPLSSVDLTEIVKQNEDTVGWLIVNNTKVNYPVVQAQDNDFYLKHAFDKSSNIAGWIFADYRDNFDTLNPNIVIYGHSRKDNLMFGSLGNVLNRKWYTNSDNQIIQLSTLKYNTMWQIFSIYKIKAESYYITTDFSSDESYEQFLKTMKERSIYNFGIDVNTNDKILTLSTCYNTTGMRIVVQAKLVKIQER